MRIRVCLMLSAVASSAMAADRHYPVLGPDGRMQVITSPAPDSPTPSPAAESVRPSVPAAAEMPDKVQEGGESWLTTEQLERKGFKPDGKNRFYYLPDGSMGKAPIESEAGIPVISTPRPEESAIVRSVRPSPNYRTFDAKALSALLGYAPECLGKRSMRFAVPVLGLARLSVEPPLSAADRSPDKVLSLKDIKGDSAIRMVSYSLSADKPAYYLPVAVWFDADGCLLSGAWNYWVNEFPGSEFRYPGMEAVLLVPEHAAFLAFFRQPENGQLPFRLQQQGSLSLELFE